MGLRRLDDAGRRCCISQWRDEQAVDRPNLSAPLGPKRSDRGTDSLNVGGQKSWGVCPVGTGGWPM
jgi:hypothetical protein